MTQYNIPDSEKEALLAKFPQGIIALDLETTGLSPLIDKIIEVAAIRVTKDGTEVFSELVDPEIEIPQYTIDIHGITDDMVKGKDKVSKVLGRFLDFIGNLPLVAHNAKFDLGFLIFHMHANNISFQTNEVYCSVQLARQTIKESENYKLKTLSDFLKIELVNHHRAADDAFACLRILANTLNYSKGRSAKNQYNLKDFKKHKSIDLPESLSLLYNSLSSQELVMIKYKGGTIKNQWRPVKPVSVLPMPQGSVLYAQCLQSSHYKSFTLKKISDVRETTSEEKEEYSK